jgi:transcriptional regulator with XRE-family HTH domain
MHKQRDHAFDQSFSEYVEKRLSRLRMTQQELADRVGIRRTDLNKYLNLSEFHGWPCRLMSKIAEILEISLNEVQQRATKQEEDELSHERFFLHCSEAAVLEPDSTARLVRQYLAVIHQCEAGNHSEAFQLYWSKVSEGGDQGSWRQRGDVEDDLAALRYFFKIPWIQPVASFPARAKATLLNWAGCNLRALGRLQEAEEAVRAGLDISLRRVRLAQEDSGTHTEHALYGAVLGTFNLSTLSLIRGNLEQALSYSEQGVDLAVRCRQPFFECLTQTIFSNVSIQSGKDADFYTVGPPPPGSENEVANEFLFVGYVQRFFACEILLWQHRFEEALSWVGKYLRGADFGADQALDYLTSGTALLLRAEQANLSPISEAADQLNQAVRGLQALVNRHHLPRALLARAHCHLLAGELTRAHADTDTAMFEAIRSGMQLYQADCHLAYARLHLACKQMEEARSRLEAARAVIKRTGYCRRDHEVATLQSCLEVAELPTSQAGFGVPVRHHFELPTRP